MPQRHLAKTEDNPNQRTKRSTNPNSHTSQKTKVDPTLTKSHTLNNETCSNGPEFGKITVVHYEVAVNHQSKPSQTRPSGGEDYMATPFAYRYGRRYLRDPSVSYPLPVDLVELHRQSLRTMLLMQVFGKPFCAPFFRDRAPKKILEVACGSALWSSIVHDYFSREGHANISFTGLDIAPLAPDFQKQGMDWRFVQHDMRKTPWPFKEGEFDYIFVKDTVFCAASAGVELDPLTELMRYLKPSGVIEVWETDLLLRALLPSPPMSLKMSSNDVEQAEATATYNIAPGTPFAKAQNKYVKDYNEWAKKAIDELDCTATPCALMGLTFSSDPDIYGSVGSRRVAIPLSEIRWEREECVDSSPAPKTGGRGKSSSKPLVETETTRKSRPLTPEQTSLRRTALITFLGLVESLEPLLVEQSGKTQDEWDRWWSGFNNDVLEHDGLLNGECLEVGAWWARKIES
ncbi:hypothetical protein G7Y79_00045g081260 [Physcia stellaris]|nr:hypothetical protein G7Y79_00045g081260 [Physcia stellaris]